MSKDQARDQRLVEASPVVAKARALAAAGHHAAVVEFLGARDQSELADPTLALLYGIAQARLGRHEQALQWIDQALAAARQRHEHGVQRHALNARAGPRKPATTTPCMPGRGAPALKSARGAASRSPPAASSTASASSAARCPTPWPRPRTCGSWRWYWRWRTSCPAPKSRCAR